MTLLLAVMCFTCGSESPIRNPESGILGRGLPPGRFEVASARIPDSGFWVRVPQESAQRLKAGQEKLKVRDFEGAIPDFERCLELQPEEYNASFGLGICFWEKDDYKKARGHFKRVVELVEKAQPGAPLPAVHQKLLGCAMLLEDFDAAVAEATLLIQFQATAEYYYARALAKQRQGDLKAAIEDCARALREDDHLTKARTLRAYALLLSSDTDAALAEYAAAIQGKPSDPEGPLGRACARYRLDRWGEALADLKTALGNNRLVNRNLERQGYIVALISLLEFRAGNRQVAGQESAAFRSELKSLGLDPSKNHLLSLPLYVGGEINEADFLKAAEASAGRKAQARCEALFFIGERKLLEGDKAGARASFRKCVDTGARGNFEHDLAQARLILLGE